MADNKEEKDEKQGRGRGSRSSQETPKAKPAPLLTAEQALAHIPEASKRLSGWLKKTYGADARTIDDWKEEFKAKQLV